MSMTLKVFCGSATNFDEEKTLLLKRYETTMNYKGQKYTNRILKFKIYAMALQKCTLLGKQHQWYPFAIAQHTRAERS